MSAQPIAETKSGMLRGRNEDGVTAFLGVPYAAPPTGPNRWRAARPHPGWAGVRDATAYGPSAPQPRPPQPHPLIGFHGEPPFDEDCLTLNIWTPAADDARRPVVVWLHGGGFLTGSGNLDRYATDTFARNGDIVAVSINYRLGPLGFLSGLGDPNAWLTDQIAAVQWIAENIAAFGGDPERITLAGQSGGAFAIAALAQHPSTRGLFQRVILQSMPFAWELIGADIAVERTRALARHLGHGEHIDALREEPWERLILGTQAVMAEYAAFGVWSLAYTPVLDPETIPRHPMETLASADVDMILGWTRDEAAFAFGVDPRYGTATRDQVIDWAATRYSDIDAAAVLAGGLSPGEAVVRIVGDVMFRAPGLRMAQERADAARPAYVYQFDVSSPMGPAVGAAHCLELPFTFGNLDRWSAAPFARGFEPESAERITDTLHRAWIGFIRDGDPTHAGLPSWPAYRSGAPAVLTVGDETRIDPAPTVPIIGADRS
ncbi:carboxylesterase/lipase family protein [Nocardia sp. IFM 10818]